MAFSPVTASDTWISSIFGTGAVSMKADFGPPADICRTARFMSSGDPVTTSTYVWVCTVVAIAAGRRVSAAGR